MESAGEVRQLSLKNHIAILNLDADTKPESINKALKAFPLDDWKEKSKINLTKTDYRGSLKAFTETK